MVGHIKLTNGRLALSTSRVLDMNTIKFQFATVSFNPDKYFFDVEGDDGEGIWRFSYMEMEKLVEELSKLRIDPGQNENSLRLGALIPWSNNCRLMLLLKQMGNVEYCQIIVEKKIEQWEEEDDTRSWEVQYFFLVNLHMDKFEELLLPAGTSVG